MERVVAIERLAPKEVEAMRDSQALGRRPWRSRSGGHRLLLLGLTLLVTTVSIYSITGRSSVEAATAPKGCCYCRQCHATAPACSNSIDMDSCVVTCRTAGCQSLVFGFVDTCQQGCGGMPASS